MFPHTSRHRKGMRHCENFLNTQYTLSYPGHRVGKETVESSLCGAALNLTYLNFFSNIFKILLIRTTHIFFLLDFSVAAQNVAQNKFF